MLYGKSNELRDLFIKTLNYVTQSNHTPPKMTQSFNLKERVNTLKFKQGSSSEEGSFQKHLLLSIVRLINADPLLMLNNQGKASHEMQSSTMELINGLVSLIHPASMADVSVEPMEALLTLHQPDKIEMWNPENPIRTFWDVSSHVRHYSIGS